MSLPVHARSQVHPLDEFYVRAGRALLPFTVVSGDAVPEPYRALLVHERDMTRTLEQHHGGAIHLRVLSSHQAGEAYWRESVLELDGSDRAVEFGAIKIHLDRFPEPWRTQILEEHLPLGGILNADGRISLMSATPAGRPPISASSRTISSRPRCIWKLPGRSTADRTRCATSPVGRSRTSSRSCRRPFRGLPFR